MAIGIANYPNITAANADYPNGQIKDAPSGTPVNVLTNGDIQILFDKLLRVSAITPNGLPDNETNGYQLYTALLKAGRPYSVYSARLSQTGTGDPTAVIYENNLSAAIVWTRSTTGVFIGTLTGEFTVNKTATFTQVTTLTKNANSVRLDANQIVLYIFDGSGSADDTFTADIEIRVYR